MERILGPEAAKSYQSRLEEGFFAKYLNGANILDIGYKGSVKDAEPIVSQAIGIDLDYPGYDGKDLPFRADSQDSLFVSHCLEHIIDYRNALLEWYRVLRVGGFLIIAVPHRYLYERKASPPSRFNGDHKRFYTSGSLLAEVEESLPVGGYRVRSLRENDSGFDYSVPPLVHAKGCYEIELVIEKIALPSYADQLVVSARAKAWLSVFAALIRYVKQLEDDGDHAGIDRAWTSVRSCSLPSFQAILDAIKTLPMAQSERDVLDENAIRRLLRPIIASAPFDREAYLARYPDLKKASAVRDFDAHGHFIRIGYYEGRCPVAEETIFA
jgi:SAM-dependent methyltransferase